MSLKAYAYVTINDLTLTTGTGTLTASLTPANPGSVGQVVTSGDQLQLCIYDGYGNFEISLCTVTTSSSNVVTFTRDTVIASSNANTAVNWLTGPKVITNQIPTYLMQYLWGRANAPATAFGSGTAVFGGEGNIYKYVDSTGLTVPAATGADVVVAAFTLPANSLDQLLTRGLTLTSSGNKANNGNTITAKIIWDATNIVVGTTVTGGRTIATTGATTTSGGIGWCLESVVWNDTVAGANKVMYQEIATITGVTHGGMGIATPTISTLTGAVKIAFTINCATTATDCSLWNAYINAMN